MKSIICDRCGCAIQEKRIGKYYVGEWTDGNTTSARVLDLCDICTKNLERFIATGKLSRAQELDR